MGWRRRTMHRGILSAPLLYSHPLGFTALKGKPCCHLAKQETVSQEVKNCVSGSEPHLLRSLSFSVVEPGFELGLLGSGALVCISHHGASFTELRALTGSWWIMALCVCVRVCVCWEWEEVAYFLSTWPKPYCSPTANSCLLVQLSFLLAVFPHHIHCLSLVTQLLPLAPIFETGWGLMVWDRSSSVSWQQTEVHKTCLYCPSSLCALCPWSLSPQGTPEPLPAGSRHTGLSSQGRAPHSQQSPTCSNPVFRFSSGKCLLKPANPPLHRGSIRILSKGHFSSFQRSRPMPWW